MTGAITLTSGSSSAYNKTALSFIKSDKSEQARIGTDSSNGLGLYAKGTIYIRPNVILDNGSTNGLVISNNLFTYNGTAVSLSGHTHSKSDITDFDHNHDNRYYTETEVNNLLANKSNTGHTHVALTPERFDNNAPNPNSKYGLTFQFSYNLGTNAPGWWNVLNMRSYTDNNYTSSQIITPANDPGKDTDYSGDMKWRQGRNSTWLDWKTILDSHNYTSYTVMKDGTGAKGTWGINISGKASSADNSDKLDGYHAMSAGNLLYKYKVTATIPASSVSGDFWYATITFSRSYSNELTRSLLDATYSNIKGQVYLNTYAYNGAWYAFTSSYNGSNIKGIALET